MEIITRKEAKALGGKFYFTGKQCHNNHVDKRSISTGKCVSCRVSVNLRYYKAHPETVKLCEKRWRLANPAKTNAKDAKYRAAKLNATVPWANKEAIEAFYAKAVLLTKTTGEQYVVDHVIPLQGQNVCGFHVETNLAVITALENSKKHNKY